jgi:ketosteroid isomerase-like protein
MYRSILVGIVALLVISTLSAQVPSTVERDLIKLENDWTTAWQKKDTAFLQKLWADEYLSTDYEGITYTKSQDLANVSDKGTNMTSFALTDLKVHVYGDTAVVTGVNTTKLTFKGKDDSGAYRFTDVFVKRDGRWQVVATHASLVTKK